MEARQARSDRPSWRDESRRPQSQGAVRPPSAAKASTSGAELLPGPEPALHHRLNSPLTYFRLGNRPTACRVRLLVSAGFVLELLHEIGAADARPGCSGSLDVLVSLSVRPCDAGKPTMRPADGV